MGTEDYKDDEFWARVAESRERRMRMQAVEIGAEIDRLLPNSTLENMFSDAHATSTINTDVVRISSKLHSCWLDCQRLLSNPDLNACQRATVQAAMAEMDLAQKTVNRVRGSM